MKELLTGILFGAIAVFFADASVSNCVGGVIVSFYSSEVVTNADLWQQYVSYLKSYPDVNRFVQLLSNSKISICSYFQLVLVKLDLHRNIDIL